MQHLDLTQKPLISGKKKFYMNFFVCLAVKNHPWSLSSYFGDVFVQLDIDMVEGDDSEKLNKGDFSL